MELIYQKEPGDCFRACLATLLGVNLASVPVFHDTPNGGIIPKEALDDMQKWLAMYGYCFVEFGFKNEVIDFLAHAETDSPRMIWILTGRTKQGTVHSAIFKGGCPIHDPACDPGGTLITEPCSDGVIRVGLLTLCPT